MSKNNFVEYLINQAKDDDWFSSKDALKSYGGSSNKERESSVRDALCNDYLVDNPNYYDLHYGPFSDTITDTTLIDIFTKISHANNDGKRLINNYIETGTNLGASLFLGLRHFSHCVSCEINPVFYLVAKYHIHKSIPQNKILDLHLEDSRVQLPKILKDQDLKETHNDRYTLFFLDAHWGENPIKGELETIIKFGVQPGAILFDDVYMEGTDQVIDYNWEQWNLDYPITSNLEIPKTAKSNFETWLEDGKYAYLCLEYVTPYMNTIYGENLWEYEHHFTKRGVAVLLILPKDTHPNFRHLQ